MKKKLPIIIICLTFIIVLMVLFINKGEITFFDNWFYSETAERMNPALTTIMIFITECGTTIPVSLLCLSLFLFPVTRKGWAFPVSIGVISSTIINLILKSIFERPRPDILRLIDVTDYSFPSGHAMINMTFYALVLLLSWHYIKNKTLKYSLSAICIVMPLIIGLSRIYLGVHYATDVIAGWTLGLIIALIVYSIVALKWGEKNESSN